MAKKHSKRRQGAPEPRQIALSPSRDIPLNLLSRSDANVRQIGAADGIAELADSIAQHSLLQSLSVREIVDESGGSTGRFEVQGGGRRLAALQLLVEQKRLVADAPIPCVIKTDGIAEVDSLTENADRAPLHPLDQFKAYAALHGKGLGVEQIAAAFGVTPAVVRQRLRLSSASPILLEAYARDELTLDQLTAYCITDDQARQDRVFASLSSSYSPSPHAIRRLLTETTVPADDRRAVFVGVEVYEQAGGTILRDLFDQANRGYLQDIDLLTRLVDAKLAAAAADIKAQGWKWVIAHADIPFAQRSGLDRLMALPAADDPEETARIEALEAEREGLCDLEDPEAEQSARIDEIDAELEAAENRPPLFAPEDMAKAGGFVTIDREGRLSVAMGYVRPEDAAHIAAGDKGEPAANGTPEDIEESDDKPLGDRLVQDLTSFRTVGLRTALAADFTTAFVAVLHALCLIRFYRFGNNSCLEVRLDSAFPATAPGLGEWPATKALEARETELRSRLPRDPKDLWVHVLNLRDAEKRELFAFCAASSVNAVRERPRSRNDEIRHADQLAVTLGMQMGFAGWTTTAENFFGRITKGQILAAVADAKGDATADLIAHLKKDAMAMEAERLIQGTGWLPVPLRLPDVVAVGTVEDEDLPDFLNREEPIPAVAS